MTIIKVMLAKSGKYKLIYASRTKNHLRVIEHKYHLLIRKAIEEQLIFQPHVKTKNRKPLQEPIIFDAIWEIRLGSNNRFRVFYDIDVEKREVVILAIGVKKRNQLFIGQERIEL